MSLTVLHGYVTGFLIIGSWATIMFWSLALRFTRYTETPTFWRFVSVAQILLLVQLLIGLVLLALGRRPGGGGAFNVSFHLLYGIGFPLLTLFVGHKWARERRYDPHAIFSVVGLVIFGLTARAWQSGIYGA